MRIEQIERFYLSSSQWGDPGLLLPQRLTERGFASFEPRDEFIASFCDNEEEREIHRHYVSEIAKTRLSRQQPSEWHEDRAYYRSPLIEDLRKRRDTANGCDGNEIRKLFPNEPWRLELDPCHANMTSARMKDRGTYGPRWKSVLDDEARLLASESSHHATGLSRDFAFDAEGRHAFLHRVLERDTAPLGFAFDRTKSTLGFSVFSKSVLPDLDLCWTLEEVEGLVSGYAEGRYRPSLELRRPRVRGRLNRAAKIDPVNLLVVDYASAMPNFGAAYWMFRNLDQLETIVKAHLCLCGFLEPLIEDAAREAFR